MELPGWVQETRIHLAEFESDNRALFLISAFLSLFVSGLYIQITTGTIPAEATFKDLISNAFFPFILIYALGRKFFVKEPDLPGPDKLAYLLHMTAYKLQSKIENIKSKTDLNKYLVDLDAMCIKELQRLDKTITEDRKREFFEYLRKLVYSINTFLKEPEKNVKEIKLLPNDLFKIAELIRHQRTVETGPREMVKSHVEKITVEGTKLDVISIDELRESVPNRIQTLLRNRFVKFIIALSVIIILFVSVSFLLSIPYNEPSFVSVFILLVYYAWKDVYRAKPSP